MSRPKTKDEFKFYRCRRGKLRDRYRVEFKDPYTKKNVFRIFYSSKASASDLAKEIIAEYISNIHVSNEDIPLTVEAALKIYIKRRESGRKESCQEHSILQVSARFKNHLLPALGKVMLRDLKVETVHHYKDELKAKGLADRTINYCISEFREFCTYCVEQRWLVRTPFDSTYKIPKSKPSKERIPDDITIFMKALTHHWDNPVNQAVALLGITTAMRISEIRALKKSDFEYFEGDNMSGPCYIISIKESLAKKNRRKAPKNEHTRKSVIPVWVYNFIKPVMDLSATDMAFSNTHGKSPISIDKNLYNLRKEVSKINGRTVEQLQDDGITFHSLRGVYNSRMTGVLPEDIRHYICGWISGDVSLAHYFKLQPVHYRIILEALDKSGIYTANDMEWFKTHNILGEN